MPKFTLLFQVSPSAVFGLPDGSCVVIPGSSTPKQFVGPTLDTRTGRVVAHGTLSEYRKREDSFAASGTLGAGAIKFRDNYLELTIEGDAAQAAVDRALAELEPFLQGLSVLYGQRFSATVLSIDDENGEPQQVRTRAQKLELFKLTVYDLTELKRRIDTAAGWARNADGAARKALFYAEHAALLAEFSDSLAPGPHVAFSRAVAFLQLFKALTALIGDPSVDRDYQSRFRKLGLPSDFWTSRAKPLYLVRNDDEDVAHYSHNLPSGMEFHDHYSKAMSVLTDVLHAYLRPKDEA